MADIQIMLNDDYPLNGVITYFEAYMFATTEKNIAKHFDFDEEIVIVDGNRSTQMIKMNDLQNRKSALALFNKLASAQIPSMPSADGLSCVMIDFVCDDDCEYDEFNEPYEFIKEQFIKFMIDTNRVAAMVQHFYQNERYPHIHMLYQKKNDSDAFQEYLLNLS